MVWRKLPFILLLITVAVLAAATVVEKLTVRPSFRSTGMALRSLPSCGCYSPVLGYSISYGLSSTDASGSG